VADVMGTPPPAFTALDADETATLGGLMRKLSPDDDRRVR
jgi:hypothetical protein